MATDIRTVTGPFTVGTGPGRAGGPADEAKQGSWRGMSITLAPAGTAAALARQTVEQFGSALPAIPARDIASRRAAAEAQFRRMPVPDIMARAQTLGVNVQRLRAGARDLLSGSGSSERSGRTSAASRYMSLQLAAAALEDDINEEAATAMLTFAGKGQKEHTPQELLEILRGAQAAGDQSDEFQHFMENVLSGLDITPDDEKELADDLRHARNDDKKLMELLRKVQNLPELFRDQEQSRRAQLREKIHNEIREFESSSEGRQVLASFNAAPVAATVADPGSFLQTYTELVTVPRTFVAALKVLLTRHALDSLDAILDKLKKALGDDLAAATPSHDTRRLGAVLTDLGHMALSTSLIESVRELVDLMYRIEEKSKREGGQDSHGSGSEADEAEDEEKERGR